MNGPDSKLWGPMMWCLNPKCRYPLDRVIEYRCPECGTFFDPSDPQLYTTRRLMDSHPVVGTILTVIGVLALVLFLLVLLMAFLMVFS